jgi:hypothetical protein
MAIAPTSEIWCPASASNAKDDVRMPPTTATASMATLMTSAIRIRLRLCARRASRTWVAW